MKRSEGQIFTNHMASLQKPGEDAVTSQQPMILRLPRPGVSRPKTQLEGQWQSTVCSAWRPGHPGQDATPLSVLKKGLLRLYRLLPRTLV